MKKTMKLLSIALLAGVSFNVFAGSGGGKGAWTPDVQPKDCLITGTSHRDDFSDSAWIHYQSLRGCSEVINRGYAKGVYGRAQVEVPVKAYVNNNGDIVRHKVEFDYRVTPTQIAGVPVDIAKGTVVTILTADWIK